MDNPFLYILVGIIAFLIGVVITRWIFGIEKIIDSLQKQNDYSLVQVRLLRKMLLNQGTSPKEIDDIISKGNKSDPDLIMESGRDLLNKLNDEFKSDPDWIGKKP